MGKIRTMDTLNSVEWKILREKSDKGIRCCSIFKLYVKLAWNLPTENSIKISKGPMSLGWKTHKIKQRLMEESWYDLICRDCFDKQKVFHLYIGRWINERMADGQMEKHGITSLPLLHLSEPKYSSSASYKRLLNTDNIINNTRMGITLHMLQGLLSE